MSARRMKPVTALQISLLLALGACQTTGVGNGTALLDDRTFMGLWRTYSHCRISEDPDAKRNDARRLDLVVRAMARREESSNALPEALRDLIEELPSRFSVDPGAMAVACALYAGQAAQTAGRYEEAVELFRSVSALSEKPGYAYYAAQAKRDLTRIEQASPHAVDAAQAGVQVSGLQAVLHP